MDVVNVLPIVTVNMKRKIWDELIIWQNFKDKMPLMLLGARQVGKTYTSKKFCEEKIDKLVYLNLLERDDVVELYNSKMNAEDKFNKLKAYLGEGIEKEGIILFIDEIQESEGLISLLNFFLN